MVYKKKIRKVKTLRGTSADAMKDRKSMIHLQVGADTFSWESFSCSRVRMNILKAQPKSTKVA